MATFFECPPIVAPTNDTVTVSNNTQLQNAIQARANGGGNENILINGTVNNIFVDGIDDIHFWFLAGSSLQDNGSQAGAAGIRFRNSDNFGVHGINPGGVPGTNVARPDIDGNSTGNNGAIWGIVVGNSFLGDPLGGACTNGVIEGVDVHHPQQEGIKVAQTGTRDIGILCNEIRDTGQEQLVHLGEGIYIGQGAGGNGGTEFLTGIRVQGNWLHEIFSGEAVDVKRGSEAIVVDNRIERVTLPFGGAITFWSDNLAAGGTGNSLIARNRINDITPSPDAFTQTSDAIQIGDEVLVENNVVWDYTGFGLSMVRQFAGPGDTIRVRHNTFDSSSGVAALGVNQDAPNGGNNFGTMNSCGNLYVGDHTVGFNFNGSTFQDTQYQSGFVGSGSDGSQYALVTSSPHVDAAPSCGTGNDICFVSRPQNGTADFGAFEFIETVEVELADDVITGVVGTPLFSNVFANDPSMGIAPTTCMVVTGATPAGIVFDSVTGTLSGTPTAAGPSRLVYQCVDSNGSADTATVTFTIVGLNNPVVLADDNFTGAIGVPALFDLTANDPNLGDPTCIRISFGLEGSTWDDELVLERYEMMYAAGLLSEAVVDGRLSVDNANIIPSISMAHDHRRILATAIARLRSKLKYRPVIFELMPEVFTLFDLQQTVESIFGRAVHKQNFRRLVENADLVEPTGSSQRSTGGRPAALFRFRSEILKERPAPGLKIGKS